MRWPVDQWTQVVERTPLISIDLIVSNGNHEVLLGWRNNKPAQHTWFVPGGVVRKGETLQHAFERTVRDELGLTVNIQRADLFGGVFEHHYMDNFADAQGFGTHYVVLAHYLNVLQHLPQTPALEMLPKAQHTQYVWMGISELLACAHVHEYTKAYFKK